MLGRREFRRCRLNRNAQEAADDRRFRFWSRSLQFPEIDPALLESDLQDLEFPLPLRHLDRDLVADFFAHERACDGGGD